ncbi:MAG: hypothetical protein KBS59_01845, partial [Clostridiales bacterium]|nr:hypothetical protein [Clostridiales bacterium]
MNIVLAKNSGFCFGVRRAYEKAAELARDKSKKIFTVGNLIHNKNVIRELENMGVYAVEPENLADAVERADENTVFIIRAHGAPKEITIMLEDASAKKHFEFIDCTCPFVKKIHDIMDANSNDNTFTFLYGDENHPEVKGISSHIKGDKFIFKTEAELCEKISSGTLPPPETTVITAAQTTQNSE